jgi:hypothetical protein
VRLIGGKVAHLGHVHELDMRRVCHAIVVCDGTNLSTRRVVKLLRRKALLPLLLL